MIYLISREDVKKRNYSEAKCTDDSPVYADLNDKSLIEALAEIIKNDE